MQIQITVRYYKLVLTLKLKKIVTKPNAGENENKVDLS